MSTLQYWEEKIKEKSKHLSFRNFSKQILSWSTFVFHRNSGMISKFPQTQRVSKVVKSSEFDEKNTKILDEGVLYNGNFF